MNAFQLSREFSDSDILAFPENDDDTAMLKTNLEHIYILINLHLDHKLLKIVGGKDSRGRKIRGLMNSVYTMIALDKCLILSDMGELLDYFDMLFRNMMSFRRFFPISTAVFCYRSGNTFLNKVLRVNDGDDLSENITFFRRELGELINLMISAFIWEPNGRNKEAVYKALHQFIGDLFHFGYLTLERIPSQAQEARFCQLWELLHTMAGVMEELKSRKGGVNFSTETGTSLKMKLYEKYATEFFRGKRTRGATVANAQGMGMFIDLWVLFIIAAILALAAEWMRLHYSIIRYKLYAISHML